MLKTPDGLANFTRSKVIGTDPFRYPIPLFGLSKVYDFLGAGHNEFAKWQDRYGLDSDGINPEGKTFVLGFPMFSKIAWTHVDSVLLVTRELEALHDECKRILNMYGDGEDNSCLQTMAYICAKAVAMDMNVEFGHP